MTPSRSLRLSAMAAALAALLPAQDWNADELAAACEGFQSPSLVVNLEQVGQLLTAKDRAFAPLVARIHGDHREYRLKVDQLLDELADPSWSVREHAERTLVEIGGRAIGVIQQRREKYDVLEQHIRCGRILDALAAKGTEQEDRERALLRGLVRTAIYLDPEPRLLGALRSALGHTDNAIAAGAIRALGKLGGDAEVPAVAQMVLFKSGVYRPVALAALCRMRGDAALQRCRFLLLGQGDGGTLKDVKLDRTEAMAMLRTLRTRDDAGAKQLVADLASHPDPVVQKGATVVMPPLGEPVDAALTMPDRTQVNGKLQVMLAESFLVEGAFATVPTAELSFADCDTIDFPDHAEVAPTETRVFLNQGSRVHGEIVAIDPESVRLRSSRFGDLTLLRKDIQGIAFDPQLDRLVGASVEHDRVRLMDTKFLDGPIQRLDKGKVAIEVGGSLKELEQKDVAGMLFTRPRVTEADPLSYVRIDTTNGERLIGFVVQASPSHVAVSVPLVGATALPWTDVRHVELGVGGGAMWGFTLIADYSDNRVVEVDDQGRVVFVLEEIFGAWDAECLDSGNLLITEFSVSRVQEVNRKGETVWAFEDLKNPYDADRLQNGNTLIADTFASRVIEVNPEGQIVWKFDKEIRPFDCDRLANGNTLIADVLKDRVIEVSPEGEVVWQATGLPNCHDADRLPNGNTLVTLRNKGSVLELDRDGKVVFELNGLSSPSDADRLPNGNTIVAENLRVREFDRHGNEVWKKDMTWAVEVNRY
ncbi:MAG: hypothetical protein R3F29_05070 [Planctomycetota bacterium]